jgi:hypothetical protein
MATLTDESSTAPATEPQRSMLCVDSSGLCLAATGDFKEEDAGIYHNLVHMASQLSAAAKQNPRINNNNVDITPVIRIETDDGCTLVKTYEAHTVAVRIPARGGPPLSDGSDGADTAAPGNDDDDDIIIVTGPDTSSDQ